jgi:hypothetical protein
VQSRWPPRDRLRHFHMPASQRGSPRRPISFRKESDGTCAVQVPHSSEWYHGDHGPGSFSSSLVKHRCLEVDLRCRLLRLCRFNPHMFLVVFSRARTSGTQSSSESAGGIFPTVDSSSSLSSTYVDFLTNSFGLMIKGQYIASTSPCMSKHTSKPSSSKPSHPSQHSQSPRPAYSPDPPGSKCR